MRVPLLVDDFLRRPASAYPEKTAIVDGDLRISYSAFAARVEQFANALLGLDLGKGARVCILSPNSHYFLEIFYATSQAGLILVPLNFRLNADEHSYIINHADVSAIVADADYVSLLDGLRKDLPKVRHWICASPDRRRFDGWLDCDEFVDNAPAIVWPRPERDENDVVSINYTSGTTARPKGVMLTHRNVYLNAYNLIAHLQICHDDTELWTLPMFHCNGWGGVYALTGMGGTHVVLRAIHTATIFRLMREEGVTLACMAPAVLRMLLDADDGEHAAMTTRPRIVVAGAPPPAAFVERLEADLGWQFIQIYGLTETSPLLTSSQADFATDSKDYGRRARAGIPGLGVQITLMDSDDNEVPKDNETIGEVCARSNVVFAGYWEQPEETEAAIRDGWFHTGDLAVWDEGGNLHIVDRKKDVIISGGENISSAEVEDTLYRHSAVQDCAVIGVPHEKWGETPHALVVVRPGVQVTEAELLRHCRTNLAHFKCPTALEFVSELPRTATGKLQKFKLRDSYWQSARRIGG